MTQTAVAPKLSATDKRMAFIKDCTAAMADHDILAFHSKQAGIEMPAYPLEKMVEVAQRMSTEGYALGRTDRWRNACEFALTEIRAAEKAGTLDTSLAHWAVFQGSVFMGHGA
ncbi:hypothetical protein [Longimicrobium sp.]|jgi:hypothetical protein|uniref:hypothetical protein n=1 Tax=Longimicrobium sp. TaxID=2029185 RepID=UPI002ED7C7EE